MADRISWDDYFIELAKLASKRSTCLRRNVGAVLVKDSQVVSTGYNGAPKGLPHCEEVGCVRAAKGVPSGERHELCRGVHAEQNLLTQAASMGTSVNGGTVYCTTFPCVICTKLLINAGITEIVYSEHYEDELSKELLREAGVKFRRHTETIKN